MTTSLGSISDVLPSAGAMLGLADCSDQLGLSELVGEARRIVVLLVDGLGYHLLPRAAGPAPYLADVLSGRVGHLQELRCTLPSTTPTSLVSLATGAAPGQHGILGFTVNVPGTDQVLTHIHWADDPPPRRWQPVATMYERLAAAGLETSVVLPSAFRGSGLTVAAYRGARFRALQDGADLADETLAAVEEGSRLVFGYTSALDNAAHVHGIASPQWDQAAADVGLLLERLAAGLGPDTVLLVTADHGGLDVPATARIDLGTDERLTAGVRLVAGEPRLRYLHTVPGATADVAATWRAVLGARADVFTRTEAIEADLFGPVRPEHVARIGDVVVVCAGDTVVLASGHEPPEVAKLVGFHGARNPEETAIPLIVLTGAAPLG